MPAPRPLRPTPLPTPPPEASMASDLASAQAEDMFAESRRSSPLELPTKSYTEAPEYQEQREKEERMVEAGEQFVGAPVVPTVERSRVSAGPEAAHERGSRRRRTAQSQETTGSEPQSEAMAAATMQTQQAEERIAAQQSAKRQRQEGQQERVRTAAIRRLATRKMKRRIMLRVAAFLAPTCLWVSLGILIIILIIIIIGLAMTSLDSAISSILSWFN
ncbi:MAG: hypothetical protein ABIK13_03400 [Patescibacteria group bacterium]